MTPEQIAAVGTLVSWLKDAGLVGGLLVFVGLLLRGDLVTRREHEEEKARTAEWKRLALRGTDELVIPLAQEVRKQIREPRREAPRS